MRENVELKAQKFSSYFLSLAICILDLENLILSLGPFCRVAQLLYKPCDGWLVIIQRIARLMIVESKAIFQFDIHN